MAMEAFLFALAVCLVANLQMAADKKMVVVSSFAFRLPLIALAVMEAHYTWLYIGSTNATFDHITLSTLMSVHLGWSLVSATILCLKPFVMMLGSGCFTSNHYLGSSTAGGDAVLLSPSDSGQSHGSRRYMVKSRPNRGARAAAVGEHELLALSDLKHTTWLRSRADAGSLGYDCGVSQASRGGTGDGAHRLSDGSSQDLIIQGAAQAIARRWRGEAVTAKTDSQ
ncbi:hypothetical protein JDV02_005604 [Purpureocillium takamizusanense]|uniref:Uncharacterized protein n=1 Tax=Purpureocillium takamizusanense TaxID=2060973 RepID=A0A9Q8QGV8_9HYPO|nr:uncharacterized protein JDV02_005604 [Purpureocillium takamizusanense]UNI19420.1 hypothetical protein JDV02_005604 [Purpureocillium takamizusanense]